MKILAIDLGNQYGWAFKDDEHEEYGFGKVKDHVIEWGEVIEALLDKFSPAIVVLSQTNLFPGMSGMTPRAMFIKAGVTFYICSKRNIYSVEFNDSSARKIVLGKSIKKLEVQKLFPNIQADALDALILARAWHIKSNQDT